MKRKTATPSREPLRLGLIGAGAWGQAIIRAINELEGVQLVAVASRNPLTRRLVDHRCLIVEDWRWLIDRQDLDGLILAVPPTCQPEIAAHALAERRPLLATRPLTTEVAAAERMYSEALRRQAVVMVDYLYLHHPAYQDMKRRLADLGPIIGVTAIAGQWAPSRAEPDVIWQWGAHEVAMALDLIGSRPTLIDAVRCRTEVVPEGAGEVIRLSLTFNGGGRASATCGNLMREAVHRLTVSTMEHTAVFDEFAPSRLVLLRRGLGGDAEAIAVTDEPPLRRLLTAFATAIRAGACDLSSLALAVDVVRVLAAASAMVEPRSIGTAECQAPSAMEERRLMASSF